jgi:RNA polymerase sigma factor (sigma-70 family)
MRVAEECSESVVRDLVEHHGRMLLRYAYQLTHDRTEAEDLFQDCALALHQTLLKGDRARIEDPVGYFKRMLVTRYLRRRHTSAADRLRGELFWSRGQEQHEAHDFAAVVADENLVWLALKELPARQRVAVVLRYYDDMSYADVAQHLSCREATARSLVKRALETIRAGSVVHSPAIPGNGSS